MRARRLCQGLGQGNRQRSFQSLNFCCARQQFYDPAFHHEELNSLVDIAWQNYRESRKSPRIRKAGPGFADPECELSGEWLDARHKIIAAQKQHESPDVPSRILLIWASPRADQTCPSEQGPTPKWIREWASSIRCPIEYRATVGSRDLGPPSYRHTLESSLFNNSTIGRSALLRRECV
jgi:hypothetical protein